MRFSGEPWQHFQTVTKFDFKLSIGRQIVGGKNVILVEQ